MFSFAQKMVILFQNSLFGEIQFSQMSLPIEKAAPYPSTTSACATNPNNILLLLQAPRSGPHVVQKCREAEIPEKETKILEKGARGDRG